MLSKLMELDAEMFDALAELEHLARGVAPSSQAIADARWRLGRAVASRIRFLETDLYPNLLGLLPENRMDDIRHLRAAMLRLRAEHTAHIANWPLSKILANWEQFGSVSRAIRDALRRLTGVEKAILYPMLATLGEHASATELEAA